MKPETAAAAPARETAVIQSKIVVSPLSDEVVERPRLEGSLARLIDSRRVVVVSATAGAGKTTAVVAATRLLHRPVAWLAVDRTDAAPGRLLTYLEAALARCLPELNGVVASSLAAGIPHAEAAGLLAEAIGDEPIVFVIDELERLGDEPEAWAIIEALVRYAPPGVCLVLVSRREIPTTVCTLPSTAAVADVGEVELAFTPTEAADALARAGKAEIDASHAVETTGGWVTGVLFEAWRSAEHVAGRGGEADPLHGYLSSQILDQIDPEDREFLVTTSLLDDVSAPRAEALGLRRAGERLMSLRAAHLPVSWSEEGRVMRCHSRFREYLLKRLERRGEDDVRTLRLAHAHGLAAEGHDEEATEEFLRAHALTEALATAERAIMPVIERVDFAIAERWLDRLATIAPTAASPLTTAELMLALARDDIRRVVRIADQLDELGVRDLLAASSQTAAWVMAWCYMHVIRRDDIYAVLTAAQPGPAVDAVRYALRVMADPPGEGKPARPELSGGPVDAFIYVADWALGRLTELSEVSSRESRWVEAVKAPWRITALRATGHTQRALELYDSMQTPGAALALQAFVGPELLMDAGRGEEARRLIAEGRALAHTTGSIAMEGMNALAEAKLALRLDRNPAAAHAALDRPGCQQASRGYRLMDEIRDTWFGLALLLESDDTTALTHLQRAVDGMVGGDRILELPTAAVYLAEAAWRAGDEEAADRAADLALQVARRQGSNHLLLQALADFPAVVSRQIDAQPGADSTWHELGRALISQGIVAAGAVRASVELREFGQRSIVVNNQQARARITKTYELLAYLATRRPPSAERNELLEALFDARADESSRSYLRQSVRDLRQILPDGGIVVEDGRVGVSDDVVITTESMRFEAQLGEAARLQGDERLSATLDAIAIFDKGDYLPGARSTWADQRQLQLTDLAIDGRYEAAEVALAAGRYDQARTLAEQVLGGDPFREAAWRLAMRIADALGDEKGVMRAYHDCEQALAELDTTPSPSTRQLLERLRR